MKLAKDIAILLLVIVWIGVGVFACLRQHQLGKDETTEVKASVAVQNGLHDDLHNVAIKLGVALDGVNTSVGKYGALAEAAKKPVVALSTTEGKIADAIDLTSHSLNDRCPTPEQVKAGDTRECGTLADTNQTLHTARGLMGNGEIAIGKFNKHEDDLIAQESTTAALLDAAISKFNALLADASVAIQTGTKTLSDIYDEVHGFVHPSKKKMTFWTATEAGGDYARHFMPPLF